MGLKKTNKQKKSSSKAMITKSLTTPVEQILYKRPRNPFKEYNGEEGQKNRGKVEDNNDEEEETSQQKGQTQEINKMVKDLMMKNKVNCRNAFDVPVIDISNLKACRQNSEGSWNTISNSLENSSKIYGFRVDYMSENINKIVSTISRSQQLLKQNIEHSHDTAVEEDQHPAHAEHMKFIQVNEAIETDYAIHLDKHKLETEHIHIEERMNQSMVSLRRMLDQNAVSAMLLANLHITPALSLTIQADVRYDTNFINCQIPNYIDARKVRAPKMTILQQIKYLREYIFSKDSDTQRMLHFQSFNQTQQLCLPFDEFSFQYQLENPQDLQKSYYYQHNNILSDQIFTQFEHQRWRNPDSFCQMVSPHQILSTEGGKKQKIVKKGKKLKTEGKRKRGKVKNMDIQMQISFNPQFVEDRHKVMNKLNDRKIVGKKQANKTNLEYVNIPQLKIQKRLNYIPPQENSPLQINNYDQYDEDYKNDNTLLTYKLLNMTQEGSEQYRLKPANIKATKVRMCELIDSFMEIQFHDAHELYQQQTGNTLSQAIGFLAILHLCNERNLELRERGDGLRLDIINPNYVIKQQRLCHD